MKFGEKLPRLLALLCLFLPSVPAVEDPKESGKKVYILPIRDNIMPPMVYLVRRGVKEAMEAGADLLILDMETNGGRVDTTEEIIGILGQFKGETVTYVNRKAFSAGAFIAVATQKIYMAPQSVIGAAAPLLMGPGGGGVEVPEAMEAKMTSGIRALVRTSAEKNGHNVEVVEAMIDRNKELIVDGKVLNEKGQILTLTNMQAEEKYGNPPKPLLSSGTEESLESLLEELGYAGAQVTRVVPTGAEKLASWINLISPILLIIGIIGMYLEFKTPGFGVPGIASLVAFAIYFLGGYVAGLSGFEWLAVFLIGLILLILELFVFTGTVIAGLIGVGLMLVAVLMAMVDIYPGVPWSPTSIRIRVPVEKIAWNLTLAVGGSSILIWGLSQYLPKTPVYRRLISESASGESAVVGQLEQHAKRIGETGIALSTLRPGGKAQFGDEIVDVLSQGEMIPKGSRVRVIGSSGREAIVEPA